MTAFRSAVLAEMRRRLIGPLPGEPTGSRYLRGLSIVPAEDPDTVLFAVDLVIYGVAVRESFGVPEWSSLAVGSPSALGRALASEVRLHIGESLARAHVGTGSTR
jgi:hypothetical protein